MYLPVLTEIWEEAARNRLFPAPDPRHQRRTAASDEIHRRLASETCVFLGGVGSGKSDTAAAYGADHRQYYNLLIWLDGDKVRRVEDLRAVLLMRGQERRNVASLMHTRSCSLVIDDPKSPLDAASLATLRAGLPRLDHDPRTAAQRVRNAANVARLSASHTRRR
ncbi:hypothetical protein [Bradyrhizobium sp. USDA 3315]